MSCVEGEYGGLRILCTRLRNIRLVFSSTCFKYRSSYLHKLDN
jgi:hypothetical protein